jgi:two-component system sensor histidine kinase EvgS
LARQMGGSISLQSESGVGTVATCLVPLERTEPAHRGTSGSDSAPRSISSRGTQMDRILVVDDHPINRLVLERQITMLGYMADTARNAEEALECIADGGYAAMLADVNMTGLDGCQLTARVRDRERRERLPRLVIIACTANAMRGDDVKCLEAGMDDYLAKPVTLSQLGAVLHRWLGAPFSKVAANDV